MQDFSRITAPMTRLTQKNAKFVWSDACENSFQLLKEKLTTAPVLTLPNGEHKFTIYCDASRVGLACVLMQNGRVVAYASRQVHLPAERFESEPKKMSRNFEGL